MIDASVHPRSDAPDTLAESDDERLIRRHWHGVRSYLRVLGADAAAADDLAQDTFVMMLHKRIEDRGAPTAAWLRRTARFLFLRAQPRRETVIGVLDEVWAETEREQGTRTSALRRCLGRLTDRSRGAVEAAYGERLSWAEIGARLGLEPEGVKTLLRRCRATLRECIEKAVKEAGR